MTDTIPYITTPTVERHAVSFSYREDLPDDQRRRAWADANRCLAGDVFATLYPNRDYTIRYREFTRPSSTYGPGTVEGIIEATVTYR